MTPTPKEPEGFSKSERYMAFLLSELPKLKTVALQLGSDTPAKAKKRDVLRTALEFLQQKDMESGCGLEFGVYNGDSLRMSANMLPNFRFYGFDSFEGFPEDDRPDWNIDFSVDGLPKVPENCTLIKGWFRDTLPDFLKKSGIRHVDFLNIDCDIYSSTSDVFEILGDRNVLSPGVVIYFDELLNYKTWIWNEMLALFEFLERSGFGIDWVAMCQNVYLADDALIMLEGGNYPHWSKIRKKGYRLSACLVLNDKGIDYGPLHLSHYRKNAKELAKIYDRMTEKFKNGEIKLEKPYTFTQNVKRYIKSKLKRNS